MKPLVHTERHDDVAVIIIEHPPVNALSAAVRRALLDAVQALAHEPRLRAGVIAGAGRTFIAGADIRELDGPAPEVTTAMICAALDASPVPVVAALHGTALGGGFEVALACHARVMAPDGAVGLPETRIGLIPGAGGTQRLPRLAGVLAALEIITSGRHVPADEAMRLGLVDDIPTDLRACAIHRGRELAAAGHWPRVRDRAVPDVDRAEFDAAARVVRKRARGAIAPCAAAEAIGWALDLPFDEALAREAARFAELRSGPQSRALRHIFHAERRAARLPHGMDAHPWPIRSAGVVGGGTMGSGIAVALADAGLEVTLVEVTKEAASAAETRVRTIYDRQVKAGRLSPSTERERLGRMHITTGLNNLADVALVVEAVVEDLAAKQEVFRSLSGVVRRDCLLASNTSYLDINKLADGVDAPERVLGLHFFNPAQAMRLLEIVRAGRTVPEALATALELARRLHKQPVIAGVCDGFIGNRIFSRCRQQCEFVLEEGALPHEVDAALEAYGFAMGPFAAADIAGLDIGWAQRKRLAPTRDPRGRYVPIPDWLCEQGRLGQKTGAGWYRHENGKRSVDPAVTALVERASAARGITRAPVPPEALVTRVHAALVNEAARVLSEGIAQRPSDIDVVLVDGYGYPAWRGGPMHEADIIGVREVLRRVEEGAARDGVGWEPAPLLREMAAAGKTFADLNV